MISCGSLRVDNKRRFNTWPSWFRFFDARTTYQVCSLRDPGPIIGYLLENIVMALGFEFLVGAVAVEFRTEGQKGMSAFVESFSGRIRDESLNQSWFVSVAAASRGIGEFQDLHLLVQAASGLDVVECWHDPGEQFDDGPLAGVWVRCLHLLGQARKCLRQRIRIWHGCLADHVDRLERRFGKAFVVRHELLQRLLTGRARR